MKPIQLFLPKFRIEETLNEIQQCMEKGWTGLGYKTVEFEAAWKEYTKLPHAHFVNSATAGLHLAVRLLKEKYGWVEGDEIISTPFTFVSTNHVILYERLTPVFADIDEYLCLDPASVEERTSPRTRAVMFVGIGGNTGRLMDIVDYCRSRNLKLILDASHMAGTRFNDKHVGRESDVAVFSFHSVKNLPTADSGIVCFKDPDLDTEVRKWTWLGINKDTYTRTISGGTYKWYYDVDHVGYKYHGNSIMAAMALISLRYLDKDNVYRRQLASWYDEFLGDKFEKIPVAPECESSRHLYQILVGDRDRVMLDLNDHQIFPGVHYRDNTMYSMYASQSGCCPYSYKASERVISLPMHLHLTKHNILRISETLVDAVSKSETKKV
jgi:dTDP-4-amino-4,6-dideoxygalactose transaminase